MVEGLTPSLRKQPPVSNKLATINEGFPAQRPVLRLVVEGTASRRILGRHIVDGIILPSGYGFFVLEELILMVLWGIFVLTTLPVLPFGYLLHISPRFWSLFTLHGHIITSTISNLVL